MVVKNVSKQARPPGDHGLGHSELEPEKCSGRLGLPAFLTHRRHVSTVRLNSIRPWSRLRTHFSHAQDLLSPSSSLRMRHCSYQLRSAYDQVPNRPRSTKKRRPKVKHDWISEITMNVPVKNYLWSCQWPQGLRLFVPLSGSSPHMTHRSPALRTTFFDDRLN